MYEDEYFISLLQKKSSIGSGATLTVDDLCFYKYFSDMNEEEFNSFEIEAGNH
jgi:hypothetical protein